MNKSEEFQEIAKAMTAAQKKVENPKKNAENPYFKSAYATLDAVIEAYKTTYNEQGINISELPKMPMNEHGQITGLGVDVMLLHESGQYIVYEGFLMPVGKNTAQERGSAITYARRYTLSSVFNISADTDDDGNAASENEPVETPKIDKSVLIAKFKQGGGSEQEFNEWYGKQLSKGRTNEQLDVLLTKSLRKKGNQ